MNKLRQWAIFMRPKLRSPNMIILCILMVLVTFEYYILQVTSAIFFG